MRSFVFLSLFAVPLACDDSLSVEERAASITTNCSEVLSDETLQNVRVPLGAACTLSGITATGNVLVEKGARLFLENATVKGNVQATDAAQVHVAGGEIGGNLQISGGAMGDLGVSITGGTRLTDGGIQITKVQTGRILIADVILVKGSLQLEENTVSGAIDVLRNQVAQNLEFRKHMTAATKVLSGNTVGQKLECADNASPLSVSGNTAGEQACGQ